MGLFLACNRWVLVALLAVMAALVIANVLSRYLAGISFPWVEEVTRYLMIWVCFLGAGPALRVGGHIAIDSLQQALPGPAGKLLRVLIAAIVAASLAYVTWLGWDYAMFGWEQETPVLNWSYGKVYLAIPVGMALCLVHLALIAPSWIATARWEQEDGFDPQAL